MLDARILLVLRLEAKKATKCLDTTLSPKELSLCWDTRFVPCNYERGWKWPLLQKRCQGESVYFYGFFFLFGCSIALDMNSWGLTGHFSNWT